MMMMVTASEPRGNTLQGLKDLHLKASSSEHTNERALQMFHCESGHLASSDASVPLHDRVE